MLPDASTCSPIRFSVWMYDLSLTIVVPIGLDGLGGDKIVMGFESCLLSFLDEYVVIL